jgi:site-specific DNA recombinase
LNKTINVLGYIRVSTHEQAEEGFSLEAQEAEIKKHCLQNNYNLLGIFCDAGVTGTSLEKRKEFQRMLSIIPKGREVYGEDIHGVLVWKLSRLSRKMTHLVNVLEYLESNNTFLKLIGEGIDTSTPAGKSFIYMAGIFAEMERENIVTACRLGMKQRAKNGKWNGGKVLGYETNNEKELEIVEDEAKIVREIFRLFTEEGWGYKKIASHLNYQGLKTLKNKDWSINSVKQILDNPLYAGYIRWGKYKFWEKKRRKGKTEDFVFEKGAHIPIITEEVWEKAKAIRDIRGKKPEKLYEGNFLLTGLLKCPICGASMVSHKTKKYKKPGEYHRYYMCGNHANKGKASCSANLVNADYAEEYVLKNIEKLVTTPAIVNSILKKIQQHNAIDTEPLFKELQNLKKELNNIQSKKEENLRMELENKISINILTQRLEFLDAREKELKEKIFKLENQINSIESQSLLNPDFIQEVLKNFMQLFEEADIKQRKRLLHSLIDKITVRDGKTAKERTIEKITLIFEPQEVEALSIKNSFAATYDTVHLNASK